MEKTNGQIASYESTPWGDRVVLHTDERTLEVALAALEAQAKAELALEAMCRRYEREGNFPYGSVVGHGFNFAREHNLIAQALADLYSTLAQKAGDEAPTDYFGMWRESVEWPVD